MVDQMLPQTPKPQMVSTTDPRFDVKAIGFRYSINWDQFKSWLSGVVKSVGGAALAAALMVVAAWLGTLPALLSQHFSGAFWLSIAIAFVLAAQNGLNILVKWLQGQPNK